MTSGIRLELATDRLAARLAAAGAPHARLAATRPPIGLICLGQVRRGL